MDDNGGVGDSIDDEGIDYSDNGGIDDSDDYGGVDDSSDDDGDDYGGDSGIGDSNGVGGVGDRSDDEGNNYSDGGIGDSDDDGGVGDSSDDEVDDCGDDGGIGDNDKILVADDNECLRNNGGCSENAGCINMPGGARCVCDNGFEGNGYECTGDTSRFNCLVLCSNVSFVFTKLQKIVEHSCVIF